MGEESIFDDWKPAAPPGVINRASPSSMDRLTRCEFQFYAVDVLKYKDPINSNMIYGFVHDDAVNYDYGHKRTAGKNLPKGDVQDYFRSAFDAKKDQILDWEGEDPSKLKEVGTSGISLFYDEVMKEVHPVEVQPKLEMTFEGNDMTLVGRPDFFEENGTIGDNKTSKSKKQDEFIAQSTQPVFYSVLRDGLSDEKREVRYDVLVHTKTGKLSIQQMKVVIDRTYREGALMTFAAFIQKVNLQLQSKLFPPTAFFRKSWECGYCPVKDLCRKVWKLPVGESKLEVILNNKEAAKEASGGDDAVIQKLKKIKELNDAVVEKVISEIKQLDIAQIKRNIII
jgi:hypothetical protein